MITYDTYLEIWPSGTVLAQVTDLPGCYAVGEYEGQALTRLRMAVPDYFRWLSMQDVDTPTMSGDVEIMVRESVQVHANALHEIRAFFSSDAKPLTEDDIDWGLALMSYAHQDLTQQVRKLGESELAWQADTSTQSIGDLLDEVAQEEAWLACCLNENFQVPLITKLPGTHIDRLDQMHERNMLYLRDSTPELRSLMREHNGERWSMRKIIRRSILNERQKAEEVAILLARYASR
jgi:hypothetical protein